MMNRADCIHCLAWKDMETGIEHAHCKLLTKPVCEGCAFFKTEEQHIQETGESYAAYTAKCLKAYGRA